MRDVARQGERAGKRRSCFARALALLWAGWWTLWIMALAFPFLRLGYRGLLASASSGSVQGLLMLAVVVCVPWVSAALAWRREIIGGLVLGLEGCLLLLVALDVTVGSTSGLGIGQAMAALPIVAAISLSLSLPPLVAGLLLLSGWWKSRSSRVSEYEV